MLVQPLVVLLIGIALVIGLIVVVRFHAFLALIISALVVSLLAPAGSWSEKVGRVAGAFGGSAGGIAIVIALAAIIGKCMMDSGAADRVVRAFVNLLGEARASLALMASGFVLAVPVFFDTVFYLLVPLARSLHRKTNKNYLKYILSIGAGAAITHTLVPPTPGPLLMAANLNIDVGMMILVGALVAAPAALVGVIAAAIMDRMQPVPMRSIAGQEEPAALPDDKLPGLLVSLAPVLIPVVLISANTALSTWADAEGTTTLRVGDVRDWSAFAGELSSAEEDVPSPARAWRQAITSADPEISADDLAAATEAETQGKIVAALNKAFTGKVYDPAQEDFDEVLPAAAKIKNELTTEGLGDKEKDLLNRKLALRGLVDSDLSREPALTKRTGRLLLESSFPELIERHTWNTNIRQAADVAGLFGNANFALLLAALVAMWTYVKQRGASRESMLQSVEIALASGGVIILITAAGGAFGAMLKEANIGDAVQAFFRGEEAGSATGLGILVLGFTISAVLKIAQGSSTVAMITASSILASMIATPEAVAALGYHPVYLATAIGAGSLVVSWMNDSGFWIFTKMGGLTEVESLRSWTILLVILGGVAFGVTVLLAMYLPMV